MPQLITSVADIRALGDMFLGEERQAAIAKVVLQPDKFISLIRKFSDFKELVSLFRRDKKRIESFVCGSALSAIVVPYPELPRMLSDQIKAFLPPDIIQQVLEEYEGDQIVIDSSSLFLRLVALMDSPSDVEWYVRRFPDQRSVIEALVLEETRFDYLVNTIADAVELLRAFPERKAELVALVLKEARFRRLIEVFIPQGVLDDGGYGVEQLLVDIGPLVRALPGSEEALGELTYKVISTINPSALDDLFDQEKLSSLSKAFSGYRRFIGAVILSSRDERFVKLLNSDSWFVYGILKELPKCRAEVSVLFQHDAHAALSLVYCACDERMVINSASEGIE